MPLFRSALSAESVDCFSVARDHLDRTMPKDGPRNNNTKEGGNCHEPESKDPEQGNVRDYRLLMLKAIDNRA